jgi:YD repeat-containing protein
MDFNIASYNGLTFTYDAENHLVAGSMQATYDGLGRCVRRTTAGGTILFTYDGWKPILEWVDWAGWRGTFTGPGRTRSWRGTIGWAAIEFTSRTSKAVWSRCWMGAGRWRRNTITMPLGNRR